MKRVRFQSPVKLKTVPCIAMETNECHSPRPFIKKADSLDYSSLPRSYPKVHPDAVAMYNNANSYPFPTPNKLIFQTNTAVESQACTPSSDLELSLFDSSEKSNVYYADSTPKQPYQNKSRSQSPEVTLRPVYKPVPPQTVLQPLDNGRHNPIPNILRKDDGFFIRPEQNTENIFYNELFTYPVMKISDNGNEEPLKLKQDMLKRQLQKPKPVKAVFNNQEQFCICHHCGLKDKENSVPMPEYYQQQNIEPKGHMNPIYQKCSCSDTPYYTIPVSPQYSFRNQPCCVSRKNSPSCKSHGDCSCSKSKPSSPKPTNAVEKKVRAIEKYEKSKEKECSKTDSEVSLEVTPKEVLPEATVSDLIKIIKLQNEQLQLLQDKVDTFISTQTKHRPIEECRTEEIAIQQVDENHHKISIGVMTSFEMFRASTFINKHQNVQCNASQMSIKEIFTKTNPQQRFLEGITPIDNNLYFKQYKEKKCEDKKQGSENDRTVNDLSLCNLQIETEPTPQISPDQTLQLDVRDYSDSEDEQSNVGWTYYNKVMTHVNGILEDSSIDEIQSSASAMYRNRGKCMQMLIDKSNVSVTKRVTFGDEQLKTPPHLQATVATDTSMRMNQLADKYLKNGAHQQLNKAYPTVDMSFATRNYMEKHQLNQGTNNISPVTRPPNAELPKFLDITALKKQPKLL